MKLYKYVGPKGIRILEEGRVHFTQLGQLNDPFEGRPHVSAITNSSDVIEQAAEQVWLEAQQGDLTNHTRDNYDRLPASERDNISYEDFNRHIVNFIVEQGRNIAVEVVTENSKFEGGRLTREGFLNDIVRILDERFGVLSLARDEDIALMWSHYTSEHKGMVIEFNAYSSFFTEPDEHSSVLNIVHEVKYKGKRPKIIWQPAQIDDIAYQNHLLQNFFLLKSAVWTYERELRVVRRFPDANNSEATEPTPKGYLFSIPPECITGVIVGCRADEVLIDQLRRLKAKSRYKHLQIRKALLDEEEYDLTFSSL